MLTLRGMYLTLIYLLLECEAAEERRVDMQQGLVVPMYDTPPPSVGKYSSMQRTDYVILKISLIITVTVHLTVI